MKNDLKDLGLHDLLEDLGQNAIDTKIGNSSNSFGKAIRIAYEIEDRFRKKEKEIQRLKNGIGKAIYNLANEDISDGRVVDEIRIELINLIKI
ncbi:hypothetical protein AAHH67_16125 [Niallia circulans]